LLHNNVFLDYSQLMDEILRERIRKNLSFGLKEESEANEGETPAKICKRSQRLPKKRMQFGENIDNDADV